MYDMLLTDLGFGTLALPNTKLFPMEYNSSPGELDT